MMANSFRLSNLLFRIPRGVLWSIAWIVALGCTVWAFGALHYDFQFGRA